MNNFLIKWILMDMTFGFELWTFDLTYVQFLPILCDIKLYRLDIDTFKSI